MSHNLTGQGGRLKVLSWLVGGFTVAHVGRGYWQPLAPSIRRYGNVGSKTINSLAADGLVERDGDAVRLTDAGRDAWHAWRGVR